MSEHSKYTSIGQFRQIISSIKHSASYNGLDENGNATYSEKYELPKINFHGTCKLHGTCSGVSMDSNGEMLVLSRKNIITIQKDNAGFAAFVKKNEDVIKGFFDSFKSCLQSNEKVVIYGEWCGKGIQKGVAINQLDKMWVIFAVKVVPKQTENVEDGNDDSSYYVCSDGISSEENRIFNINEFKIFNIEVDFDKPEIANNKIIDLVDQVEKECPVGKHFGVSGIGEGIVWTSWVNGQREHIFKTKGEEHAKGSGKVKTLKPVDEAQEQKKRDFVNNVACKVFRLDQMYTEVFNVLNGGKGDIRKTGDYIRAVIKDVMKEETDILVNNGLNFKDVNKLISKVARNYMIDRMNDEVGL